MVELGCSTILFGGHPLDVALDGIARAGYRAIELCSIPGMADHLPVEREPQFYDDIAAQVRRHGLVVESVGATTNVLDPERHKRFVQVLHLARAVGAPLVTTSSGGVSDDEASFQEVVRTFRELARRAQDLGVRISVKPHVRAAVYSTPTALRFVKEVDSPWIGLNYDATHLYRNGEQPDESLKQLRDAVFSVRIRDMKNKEGGPGPVEEQIPGGGALNLPAICAVINTLPVRYAVLEIVGAKEFPRERVQQVIEASYAGFAKLLNV